MKGLKVGDDVSFLKLKEKRYIKGRGSKGKFSWVCECVCGTEVIRREDLFKPGKAMSCGCKHPSKTARNQNSPLWRGCGNLSHQFFSTIRFGATRRGIGFHVAIEELWQLFEKQNGRCVLTGLPLTMFGQRDRQQRGLQQTASLDRIDSNKDYTLDNVWWVHKDVNMMRKEYSVERFREICRLVVEHDRQLTMAA